MESPAKPGVRVSLLITANNAAKKDNKLAIVSVFTPSHLYQQITYLVSDI